MSDRHDIRLHWEPQEAREGMWSYSADCSCGWETAFTSNRDGMVLDQMADHAKRVQAASNDRTGRYV